MKSNMDDKNNSNNVGDEHGAIASTKEVSDSESEIVVELDSETKEMLKAGVHFGHRKTWQHPHMLQYIFGVRNTVSIIDLSKTKDMLGKALKYIKSLTDEGKTILFVDTKPSTKEQTKKISEDLKMPYVVERWAGGTLTNWKTISDRIEYLKDLESKTKQEDWNKYTKKERSDTEEEIKKLNFLWGGIKNMERLPDAIFVVDMKHNSIALREAKIMNIPIVAISDTNVDPELADYPIPANDDALSSVKYILSRIKKSIKPTKKKKK